ncbi:MAG: cytidylyltransferase domain-containing protein [Actinomycetota bacterium]
MIDGKRVLGLIPARGGSKGLPGKNIRPLCGKPLIAWSIEQGRASACVDAVVVSTDSQEIADVARTYGAEVPFLRPAHLAADTSPTIDAVIHALDFLAAEGREFDIVALLETTSPLRDVSDIDEAVAALVSTPGAESIVGVAQVEGAHPDFLTTMDRGFLRPYRQVGMVAKRRQELEALFYPEGTIYVSYAESLRRRRSFYHEATLGHVGDRYKAFEIDELCDAIAVEALLAAKLKGIL